MKSLVARWPWRDVAAGAVAGGLALKATWDIARVRDVFLNDETVYLASGVRMLIPGFPNDARGLPPASWSPLYACWYLLLHVFVRDSLWLYYASWTLLVVGTSVALFAVARALGAPRVAALFASFVLVTSEYLDVWPYPSHFAVLLILLGTLAALRAKDARGAYRRLLVTSILCTFVRPEFAVSAAVFALLYVYAAWRATRVDDVPSRLLLRDAAVILVPALVLVGVFGSPLGGDRSFFAWGQHYALGQVTQRKLDVNPWLNWLSFVEQDFGKVSTIGGALRANPRAFLAHVAFNVRSLPSAIGDLLRPHLVNSKRATLLVSAFYDLLALVGLVGLGALALRKDARATLRTRVAGAVWFAVACETLPSVVIVYPRAHYVLPIVTVSLALLAAGWRPILEAASRAGESTSRRGPLVGGLVLGGAAALLLAVTPSRAYGACVQTRLGLLEAPSAGRRETVDVVAFLRGLGLRKRPVVLEQSYSYVFYTGLDFDRLIEWEKTRPFFALLRERDVSLVVLSPHLDQNPAFSSDPEYRAFAADPSRYGFHVLPVPGTPIRVALRDDLSASEAK